MQQQMAKNKLTLKITTQNIKIKLTVDLVIFGMFINNLDEDKISTLLSRKAPN